MREIAYKTAAFEVAFKTAAFNAVLSSKIYSMSYSELMRGSRLLQRQASPLLQQVSHQAAPVNSNEDLYQELELRYGSGFAQTIVDGLKRS